jgi:hypothetical protein
MRGVIRTSRRFLFGALALVTLAAVGLTSASKATAAAPSFVQQVSARGHAGSLAVTPGSVVTAGDRMVVEVGVWSSSGATATSVTDSVGNTYTELVHFQASDSTELSVWSAPVTAGGGTKPTITVKATGTADIAMAALEYSGLSAAGGTSVLDVSAHKSATTLGAATVSSGATAAATGDGELAIGLYADSGFADTLTAGTGWTGRVNVAPTSDMELLAEDQSAGLGSTPNATAGTGASTVWLMATIVLKHG